MGLKGRLIDMHMLLYLLGVSTAITGAVLGVLAGTVNPIAMGLLVAILFGGLGKIVHLLELMESHLREVRNKPAWGKAQIVLSTDDLIGHGLSGLERGEREVSDPHLN